jgi:hypothetical protein
VTHSTDLRALLVTLDPWLIMTFKAVSGQMGIVAETSTSTQGLPMELDRDKYEALLVDYDTVGDTIGNLANLRENSFNQNIVLLAVATDARRREQALKQGIRFLLERPFVTNNIKQRLDLAYDLMKRERRRYFRCAAELLVRITRAGSIEDFECKTMNVSSGGMAILTTTRFTLGETLKAAISLSDQAASILVNGTVVWDDKHGKTGVTTQCASPEMQLELDAWLDRRFQETHS